MNCKNCGAEYQENVGFCPACGEITEEVEVRGMKWHKFKTYFIMPLGSLVNLSVGILLIPAVMNRLIALIPDAAHLYAIGEYAYTLNFDSIKILNTVFALVSIALAFYYAYVSFVLMEYKKGAPKHVYISLVLSEASGLIYSVATLIIISTAFGFDSGSLFELFKNLIARVVTVAFWMLVYMKYYNKREHMFIN